VHLTLLLPTGGDPVERVEGVQVDVAAAQKVDQQDDDDPDRSGAAPDGDTPTTSRPAQPAAVLDL
jgi:hypothetical protein